MGAVALATPERVVATFGQRELTLEGRNEVRAVYGGFGVVVAAVLAWAAWVPAQRTGVFLTVAASLAGMALGRLVSAAVEWPRSFYPSWFYCALELAMAATLALAAVAG
jgi:hypothetical protein